MLVPTQGALAQLSGSGRLRFEVSLRPAQGERFQPTGFPDLGPATFRSPDAQKDQWLLLVESPQSIANRLEAVCWDSTEQKLVPELVGLPYVHVTLEGESGETVTSSLLEAHRLNSPYIMNAQSPDGRVFSELLRDSAKIPGRVSTKKKAASTSEEADDEEGAGPGDGVVDIRKVAAALWRFDPNSVLHGAFLTVLDGRARLARALSGFIEATDVREALNGGVKIDRIQPGGNTAEGYGNVPYQRTEFVSADIRAFFTLDVALLRSYGLDDDAVELLTALSLWKVRRFLHTGLRLRTACDLTIVGIQVTEPHAAMLPEETALTDHLRQAIKRCASQWSTPPVTELHYSLAGGKTRGRGSRSRG